MSRTPQTNDARIGFGLCGFELIPSDSIEATERLNRRVGANQTDPRRSELVTRGASAASVRFVMLRLALKHIKRFSHLLHRIVDRERNDGSYRARLEIG